MSSSALSERAALRSALVQLVAAEDELHAAFLPALVAAPSAAALVSRPARFRERRLGSCAGTDLLDAGAAALFAGAAPLQLPGDRLATFVAFSGLAEGSGQGAAAQQQQQRQQQREWHRASMALLGLCATTAEDARVNAAVLAASAAAASAAAAASRAAAAAAAAGEAAEGTAVGL